MTNDTPTRIAPAEAHARRRNMLLLIQLRWIAVGGQMVTIGIVHRALGIPLPLAPLLATLAVLIVINLVSLRLVWRRPSITNRDLTAALLIDVAALAWQLHFTGGLGNPFTALFLLQIVIGAILLRPASSWAIVGATLAALALLGIGSVPLDLPLRYRADPLGLYLAGSLACFALIAVLLVAFVTRISRNLHDRDTTLAAIRQRAAEEDHIVRMGLLASGAAHELGTPLAALAVVIGDWQKIPRLAADRELRDDLADMDRAVQRCKAIVSGILISAGEARGVAPQPTTVRSFVRGIVDEWRVSRRPAEITYLDRFGEDMRIVSDPALRQVISNVIDNAAEASPSWVGITASRRDDRLVLDIEDRGPGFTADMLKEFGKPYRSTKGRPGGGLGLFLLVNVLRKLGGDATAANRADGGALVRLLLPLDALALREDKAG